MMDDKYEKALKRAQAMIDVAADQEEAKRYVSTIFPELAESEDERIRKELLSFIESVKHIALEGRTSMAIRKEDIAMCDRFIPYLERQKERASIPDELVKHYKEFCERGGSELANLINAINGYGEQSRPIVERKPAEWSEKDNAFLKVAIAISNRYSHKDIANWLESLPERFNLTPKSEWSEEDEKTINDACCWLAEYAGYLMDKNYGKASMLMGLTEKLKFLRPQPHWKPSDEQMDALVFAEGFIRGNEAEEIADTLESLSNDLKKLKED